ncbi:MAG: hypothetical protein VKO44_08525 [Cyanobacteriota bacterium]|nr:hypothetical protein [Cyanobacteriota bacterium]
MSSCRVRPLLLAGLTLLSPSLALARGGGGFGGGGMHMGGGGFGGYHFGGAGYDGRGMADGWMRGYQGYHPHYGPGTRPAWREDDAWRNDPWSKEGARPLNPRATLNDNGNVDRNSFQKTVNVNNNFYNRNPNGWNANWAQGGYWNNRPWNAGWYGWTPATWGWWGWNSAGWGLAGLATGLTIADLVNAAANRQQTVIVVPGTTYQLNYGTVESVGLYGVSFSYSLDNGASLMGAANCQAGLLNGQVPATAAQAQLLNAVCQVAYGKGS